MVRFILAVVFVGAGVAEAQLLRIDQHDSPDLAVIQQPDDGVLYSILTGGRLWQMVGSWQDDTMRMRGAFWLANWNETPIPAANWIEVPLPNRSLWSIRLQYIAGVMWGGDALEDGSLTTKFNDVDIHELNAVWNDFGRGPLPNVNFIGDVTYDGQVDIDDLNLVRNNFGMPSWYCWNGETMATGLDCRSHFDNATATPEPSTAVMLALGLCCLSRRLGRARFR